MVAIVYLEWQAVLWGSDSVPGMAVCSVNVHGLAGCAVG